MKKRIVWIDMLKGWGMLLVMLGHAPLPGILSKYIYTFHVPLFFFISGYLFKDSRDIELKEFIKKKNKGLLRPYLIFSLFNCIVFAFRTHELKGIIKSLIGIIIPIRGTSLTICNGTFWFVIVLFISEVILFFIIKYLNNDKKIALCLIIFSILGYLYYRYIGIKLPWNMDAALVAVVFVGLGYLSKKYININSIKYKQILLLFILNLIIGMLNKKIDMFSNQYGNYLLFYLAAISGIFMNVGIIIKINNIINIKILEYIGKNSFVFLALHQYFIYSELEKILNNVISISYGNHIIRLLISILFVIITIIVLYPIIYVINRYFPWILGKKKNNLDEKLVKN